MAESHLRRPVNVIGPIGPGAPPGAPGGPRGPPGAPRGPPGGLRGPPGAPGGPRGPRGHGERKKIVKDLHFSLETGHSETGIGFLVSISSIFHI